VTPGPIDTPIVGKVFTGKDEAAQIREKMAAMVPMKRWGTSEEIAKAILFLGFRRDLHERPRASGRWGLVATVKAVREV